MSPRQRSPINRGLPANLRYRDGTYSYRVPKKFRKPGEKGEYGLGIDRRNAIEQALKANAHLYERRFSLVERMAGAANTWGEWCDEFERILAERESKPTTVRTRRSQMVRLRASFDADRSASRITTKDCAQVIDAIKGVGHARTAQAFRSFMIDCFDRMVAKGWRTDNPARVLDPVRVKVKRARLTLEAFQALYTTTSVVWLRNAMALALVAGKDRDSVRNAKFADFRDGGWWNERSKTEARVFLPFNLRLKCFGMSLEDVRGQCLRTGVISKYLVHQTQRSKGATLGKPLNLDTITRVFSAELAKLHLPWGDKAPPTFHEIRSLAARLYKQQGDINPQDLLSHKDPRSTAVYADGRGEWVFLKVPE